MTVEQSISEAPVFVKELCISRGHYETPRLNDCLFLHSAGISSIDSCSLHLFYNLKSLHLSGNNIREMTGLERLIHLRSLYLQSNIISAITGLSDLIDLRVLDLSKNRITQIAGVCHLRRLTNLNLESNDITILDSKQGEQLESLSSLTQLNLSKNKLNVDNPSAYFATYTPRIKCLYVQGNEAMRGISRDSFIQALPHLTWLDSRPVVKATIERPVISPSRADALTQRRQLAIQRIARERANFPNSLHDLGTDLTALDEYAIRIRNELSSTDQQSTAYDESNRSDQSEFSSLSEMD